MTEPLTIGFLPLVDACLPILAHEHGFAEEEGLALTFQRDVSWFLDENADVGTDKAPGQRGGAARVPLEPSFLFAKDVLQAAIPELLATRSIADEETLFRRISRRGTRPLLQTKDPRATMAELWRERQPLYRDAADVRVDTSGLKHEEVADAILRGIGKL